MSDNQNLYINIDDCFLTAKINSKGVGFRIRPLSFNTGLKNGKLQNKRITFTITKKSEDKKKSYYLQRKNTVQWIKNELNKFYENWENANLIVAGDGANWITALSKNMKSKQILSRFHFIQNARNSFLLINNNNYRYVDFISYKNFWNAINKNDVDSAIFVLENYLKKLQKQNKYLGKIAKTKIFINYIKNNYFAVQNYSQNWNIGCSAESDVYHLVKQTISGRTYNSQILSNIVSARALIINNIISN